MPWIDIIWNEEPGGNVEHVMEHGITREEVREVLESEATDRAQSESSGLPIAMGFTAGGRFLVVVYEQVDAVTVHPITAYEVE